MKKLIVLLCIILIAAVGWKYYLSSYFQKEEEKKSDELKAKTVTVKRGPIHVTVAATGRVVPEQEVEIKCKASGEIIKLPVDISDKVKKGDIILKLDPEDEERAVKQAGVSLAVSQAKLEQAKQNLEVSKNDLTNERSRAESALKSAEAKMQESEAKLNRVEQLLEKKMASREELDGVQTEHAQALAELENSKVRMTGLKTLEVQIDSKQQDIKIAEAQLEANKLTLSNSQQRLLDTTVTAPISGVVVERNVQVGQIIASGINNVGGGTTVMKIADLSHIYVLVSVDESDIGKIKLGQNVKIMVDAYPETVFSGEIVRVATKGAIASNVVTFEVKVEVKGDNRNLLKPEMTANVEIITDEKDNVILIPVDVIEKRDGKRFIKVQKPDGKDEERVINTGITDGEFIEVLDNLAQGESVLIPQSGTGTRWKQGVGKDASNNNKPNSNRMPPIRMMGSIGGGGRR